jgi:hypothetical protein
MKRLEFEISRPMLKKFFPHERVKTKLRVLEILLEASRYMLQNLQVKSEDVSGKIVLHVDKMSRLFFIQEDKSYSISFPFLLTMKNDSFSFSFNNEIEIDSETISHLIAVIKDDTFIGECSLDFADSVYSYEQDHHEKFWTLLRELVLLEDGYIRFDKDEENFLKAQEKGEERKHPLFHFDIFYTGRSTFKTGLYEPVNESRFVELLDTNENCEFYEKRR